MKHNIDRVTKIVRAAIDVGKFIHSCFDWENKMRSILAFLVSHMLMYGKEIIDKTNLKLPTQKHIYMIDTVTRDDK